MIENIERENEQWCKQRSQMEEKINAYEEEDFAKRNPLFSRLEREFENKNRKHTDQLHHMETQLVVQQPSKPLSHAITQATIPEVLHSIQICIHLSSRNTNPQLVVQWKAKLRVATATKLQFFQLHIDQGRRPQTLRPVHKYAQKMVVCNSDQIKIFEHQPYRKKSNQQLNESKTLCLKALRRSNRTNYFSRRDKDS